MITKRNDLVSRLHRHFRIQMPVEEPSSGNMFTTDAGTSTLEVGGKFVFFQTLIDCLQRMKPNQQDKTHLVSNWKENCQRNSAKLNRLRQFESTYSPDTAIWWYTAEQFFYDTINTALRDHNIDVMLIWRSFLFDIYHTLHRFQLQHKVKVYRCQIISKEELETLKGRIGKLVSTNSFLSTSDDREVAKMFVGGPSLPDNMRSVLFEIEADPLMVDTKPFADITLMSQYPEEREILFMFGSVFRVSSVDLDETFGWIIRMSLCDDDDQDVRELLKYKQKQNGKGETNLHTLGKLVWQMGNADLAKKYYDRFLEDPPSNDTLLLTNVYEDLAAIRNLQRDYNGALDCERKVLQLKLSNRGSYYSDSRK